MTSTIIPPRRSRSRRATTLSGALALVAVLVGACGTGGADTERGGVDDEQIVQSYQDEEARLDELYQTALDAGETSVVYYPTALGYEPVIEAFEKRFPEIDVKYEVLLGPALNAKLAGDFAAGTVTIDVAQLGEANIADYSAQGRIARWEWPQQNGIPNDAVHGDGTYFTDYRGLNAVVWNTTRVSADEVPTSWREFLDPKWEGRVGFQRPSGGVGIDNTFTNLYAQGLITAEEIGSFAQFPTEPGNAQLVAGLTQGKYDIVPNTWGPAALSAAAEGAPLGVGILDDFSIVSNGFTVIFEDSPNPNAARLLMAWLLSHGGQNEVVKSGYYGIYDDLPVNSALPPYEEVKIAPAPLADFQQAQPVVREITQGFWP
ncbi:extracellular solute-binding protein [Rhodococcus rhodochrous]|uniref:ABC transporter substrate-binding protein n=1 Tax=Rhodococcus rhodochrous TaxID=1829 RepID=UPI001E2F217B|nr:extracellular solute-binding protein [Rhodococcus rhodochrous]MCB8913400.1 extracellular solute-binding protein [Rhodococcus rhodochrous]